MLKNVWKHFKKICVHKWWVFYYCYKAGIPWRGFMHDWSKFSPTEFRESVRFYQGTSSPIDAAKKEQGYSMAWQHHKGRNPHHYEYWTDNYDKGTTNIVMPYKYAVEMFCDYIGAARAYMGKDFSWGKEYEWWQKKKEIAFMHPKTKAFMDQLLLDACRTNSFPDKFHLRITYIKNCTKRVQSVSVPLN